MVLLMVFQAVYFGDFLSFYTMQLEPPKIVVDSRSTFYGSEQLQHSERAKAPLCAPFCEYI